MAAKGKASAFDRFRKGSGRGKADAEWTNRVERLTVDEHAAVDPPEIDFIDLVKAAMANTRTGPTTPPPPLEFDLDDLAREVSEQQSVEPKVPRVSVASVSWNALAAHSVAAGLRRAGSPERDRVLYDTALLEPTHLTPIAMTAAAALALRAGEFEPWRTRAESRYHDHRAIPGLDKAGVMIGLGFTGPGTGLPTPDEDGWFTLDGIDLIVHSYLYDALIVRIPEPDGRASCYLLPIHTERAVANGIKVNRLFGRPGTAPGAFAEVTIHDARALRIGPAGVADELLRPAIDRLRSDAAIVGAAQMRAAVDALSYGLERRRGADVFHRLVAADIEATVAAGMAAEASQRIVARSGSSKLPLVLAQHWVKSRYDAIVPDAAAVMRLAEATVAPSLAWTSPLVTLWGGTRTVLRADFAQLAERGDVARYVDTWDVDVSGTPLAAAMDWLRDVALDESAPVGDRLEASTLMWAVSLLVGQGRVDAAGTLLGAEVVPMRRSGGPGEEARVPAPPPVASGEDVVIDLRDVFEAGATSGRDGRPLHSGS